MPKTTNRAKAEAHEALFLRLQAALAQVAAIAARHPEAAVPDETRAIAEGLLYDSAPFARPFVPSSHQPRVARNCDERDERLHPARPGGGAAKALERYPRRRVRGLPAAAGTVAALASQLGQAMAVLEMWEAEHSGWDGAAFCWRLTRGEAPLPIQRLRAKAKLPADTAEDRQHFDGLKAMLWRRIDARFGEGYDRGYADAREGLPNRRDESSPRRVIEG